jgi:hypothetical protein
VLDLWSKPPALLDLIGIESHMFDLWMHEFRGAAGEL